MRQAGVQHLLGLVRLQAAPQERALLDDLDVSRRVETVLPALARAIDAALIQPVQGCARALLAVARQVIPDLIPPDVPAVLDQVLARAEAAERLRR